jgi:uncharacterized protein (DUF58 family)
MELISGKPQLTTLLDNRVLARLEKLRIMSTRRFTDRRKGERLSGRIGTSNEFSDYRNYVPGDDVRFLDWNIFARLNRPFLKLYRQEEEMHVALLLDGSSSMAFENKFERARQLAAAFGVMGLLGTERVSVTVLNSLERRPGRLTPCTGRANMMKLFAFLEGTEPGGIAPVDEGIEVLLRYHVGRGIVVILSDFLTFGDMKKAFNRLFAAGLETFGIQVLGPTEIEPDVTGEVRLVDSETEDILDVSASELRDLYLEHNLTYQGNLAELCRQRSGRFLSISSDSPVEWVLFDLLRRRGWIR